MAVLDKPIRAVRFHQVLKKVELVESRYNRPLKIADIGAGGGVFSQMLIDRGHSVDGFDTHNCNLEDGIPCADQSYDLVVCIAVVEHLHKWHEMLSELRRVGDHVILTTPSVYGRPVLNALAFFRLAHPGHIADHKHYLTSNELCTAGYRHNYFLLGLNQLAVFDREENNVDEVAATGTVSLKAQS